MVNDDICPDLCKKNASTVDKLVQMTGHDQNLGSILAQTDIPPLHVWHPTSCGDMDLCIHADGTWWHEGKQIHRDALIHQFSRILCKEGQRYFLKTPVEKIAIQVQDAPLRIERVDQISHDQQLFLCFYTTDGDCVVLDAEHPIFMQHYQGQDRPYIRVRYGLHALIPRNVFFHVLEYGELHQNQAGETTLALQSGDFCLHLTA